MCTVCGCSSGAKATLVNLETGHSVTIAHDHEEEHVHADGTRHRHSHGAGHGHDHNPAHDHEHDHEHGHSHNHDHGHSHSHAHGDGHEHDHHHHHGHGHDHDHDHAHHGHGHDHDHDHGHDHSHGHHHHEAHGHSHGPTSNVALEARVLAKNDALASRNRAWFAGREILALNLVSSPGSGKTTLLERTIHDLKGEVPIFVVEGDQATANDGERIRAAGAACVQVNTGTGCHLEADMVARGLSELRPPAGAVVMIENVGNLVCPALFDLGERAKIAILSVTEGEDKPLKYPHMFRAAEVMVLNKIDLLPYVDFKVEKAIESARAVNPDIAVICVSAKTGEGLDDWYAWIRRETKSARESAF